LMIPFLPLRHLYIVLNYENSLKLALIHAVVSILY